MILYELLHFICVYLEAILMKCIPSLCTLLIHDCFHVLHSYSYKRTAEMHDARDEQFIPVNCTILLIFMQRICQF